jgi:uncharacterized membrane protein
MGVFESLLDFFEYYFVRPVFDYSGYNVYNTLGYILLFVAIMLVIKKVFEYKNVRFDQDFFWMLFPFVVFGGALRSLEDLWEVTGPRNPFLVTPMIYIVILIGFSILFFGAMKITRDYKKPVERVGWALALVALVYALSSGRDWISFGMILGLTTACTFLVSFVLRRKGLRTKETALVVFGQMLDASASVVAIAFLGYSEQHVVSGLVMQLHPFAFLLVKMVLSVLVIYALFKETSEKSEWRWMLLFAVLMIGLAPGTRDILRVLMGV